MKVKVNGEDKEFAATLTVAALLDELGIEVKGIAVERNREIVPRGRLAETQVSEGDEFEIVRMVGGG